VSSSLAGNKIPVIITCKQQQSGISCRTKQSLNSTHRSSILVRLKYQSTTSNRSVNHLSLHTSSDKIQYVPSLYVFNAASLAKPHAIENLSAELDSCKSDIAVISETHFKEKHTDSVVSIPGHVLYRKDRKRRRGGGVAVYVRSTIYSSLWCYSREDPTYELLWVQAGSVIVGALYHPPKPQYSQQSLMNYIESVVEELSSQFPGKVIVLAGDMNQLAERDIIERTGLTPIVYQPTRGSNVLDRIYVSDVCYSVVRVVKSTVKSDHQAVVAYSDTNSCVRSKSKRKFTYRKRTPTQHALFLQHVVTMDFDFDPVENEQDIQAQFDHFYEQLVSLLNVFYPERDITVTNRDPDYVNGDIKSKLRRKNRVMRAGRVEEASALAARIGKDIARRNATSLKHLKPNSGVKEIWDKVRQLTKRRVDISTDSRITANTLNTHYAGVSTDSDYHAPHVKQTAGHCEGQNEIFSEMDVFHQLDHLHHTATGLDKIPAWFLRLGAAVFAKPIAHLFNASLAASVVPSQWKKAWICPIAKIKNPTENSHYRPISITPVLVRVMERMVVRQYLYPCFENPPPSLKFCDQFAFRRTGSTTAALITLFHTVTELLATNTYVAVYALDFSKAFDSVRHSTLLDKLALLDIPDNVYNWFVDFFTGHSHCTRFHGHQSNYENITASIIQGSALGPASYVVTASDLINRNCQNVLVKYADDTYLIVPAKSISTVQEELDNIEQWSLSNNLKLNRAKSAEIVFVDNRRKSLVSLPAELSDIKRVHSLKILGVTVASTMTVNEHVDNILSSCAQSLFALKTLRAHGMDRECLHNVFKAIILAKLTYASSAWIGFTRAPDRDRIEAFIRRCKRSGLCSEDIPTFAEQCDNADYQLFTQLISNPFHTLHQLLPPVSNASQNYNLRQRKHNRSLPHHSTRLADADFINRILYCDIY